MAYAPNDPNTPNYLGSGKTKGQYDWDVTNAEAMKAEQMKAKGLNPDGSPIRPAYQSASSLLNENLQSKFNPNTQGLEAFRARALQQGPSAWANQALQQQALEEQGQKNNVQQQGASGEAQARSALASKYGLSPAAQQRLAMQNQRSQMSGLQNVGFQGAQARANIGTQDEATKNQFLQSLPGQELNYANANTANQQFNIGQAVGQNTAQNAYNANAYNEQMRAWAAGKTADAQANAGGGGGSWVCTKINEVSPFTKREKTLLMRLRRYALHHNPSEANFYLHGCSELTKDMTNFIVHRSWINKVLKMVSQDRMLDAYQAYKYYILDLMRSHWTEGLDKLASREIREEFRDYGKKKKETLKMAEA